MAREDMTVAVVAAVAFGAAFGGLLWWGSRHASAPSSPAVAPSSPGGLIVPVVLFPDLKVGDGLIVDAAKAALPAPFAGLVPAVVDQVLSDPTIISVHAVTALPAPATFSGTIKREAIARVVPASLPAGFIPVI